MNQNIKLLKAVVIGLGVLLVAGLALLVAAILVRSGALMRAGEGAPTALTIPGDARIVDMSLGDGMLAVRVAQGESEEIVIVDAKTGQVLRRLSITPAHAQ